MGAAVRPAFIKIVIVAAGAATAVATASTKIRLRTAIGSRIRGFTQATGNQVATKVKTAWGGITLATGVP